MGKTTAKAPADKFDIFVFDTETTGLSNKAEIIEFGGILMDGRTLEEKDTIHTLIAPSSPDIFEEPECKKAFSMNHMAGREDELLKAPSFQEFCASLWLPMREKHEKPWMPSGYNVDLFDIPKLKFKFWQNRGNLPQFQISQFFDYHSLDCMPLFMRENWFNPQTAYVRQKDALSVYGVDNKKAHQALEDARACAELLRRMLKKSEDARVRLADLEAAVKLDAAAKDAK